MKIGIKESFIVICVILVVSVFFVSLITPSKKETPLLTARQTQIKSQFNSHEEHKNLSTFISSMGRSYVNYDTFYIDMGPLFYMKDGNTIYFDDASLIRVDGERLVHTVSGLTIYGGIVITTTYVTRTPRNKSICVVTGARVDLNGTILRITKDDTYPVSKCNTRRSNKQPDSDWN